MKVYQYDNNGYYIGETKAHEIKGKVVMPHNTTPVQPEIKDGFIPRWIGSIWVQVENHKGEQGYINGVYTEIKEYGALPDGWSSEPPKPEIDETKARIEKLKRYLTDTDYTVIKLAESGMTKDDWLALPENQKYAEVFTKREAARVEISDLEASSES